MESVAFDLTPIVTLVSSEVGAAMALATNEAIKEIMLVMKAI